MRSGRHQNGIDSVVEKEAQILLCGCGAAQIQVEEAFQCRSLKGQEVDAFQGWYFWLSCSGELLEVVLNRVSSLLYISWCRIVLHHFPRRTSSEEDRGSAPWHLAES